MAQKIAAVNVVPQNYAINVMAANGFAENGNKQSDMVNQNEAQSEEQCRHNMSTEGTLRRECGCKILVTAVITGSQRTCENTGLIEQRPLSSAKVNAKKSHV